MHHWHLEKNIPQPPIDPRLQVRDPVIIQGRGRKKDPKKRVRSIFERAENSLNQQINQLPSEPAGTGARTGAGTGVKKPAKERARKDPKDPTVPTVPKEMTSLIEF